MLERMQNIIWNVIKDETIIISELTNYREDLELDSLDMFEMIIEFEKEFEIKIPTEALKKMHTVKDTINYIEQIDGE